MSARRTTTDTLSFRYGDASDAPDVEKHAGLPDDCVANARALGFVGLGWIEAVLRGSDGAPTLTYVMVHPNRTTSLSLSHSDFAGEWLTSLSLKDMLADGTIVNTENRPGGRMGLVFARGAQVRAVCHAYDLEFIETANLAELVDLHLQRAARASADASGRSRIEASLTAHVAMRRRYREIHEPVFAKRDVLSRLVGGAALLAVVLGMAGVSMVLGLRTPLAILAVALLATYPAVKVAIYAYKFSLFQLSPILIGDADAPAPRRAQVLLEELGHLHKVQRVFGTTSPTR
jgi:hypothetical protein